MRHGRRAQFQPMAALNITPLIDVLLVLLVMLILTIPMATHKVAIDLPVAGPPAPTPPDKMHRLDIAANGALTLDGAAVDEAALPARLAPLVADTQALLTINADAASRYDTFDHVLATIKRAGVTRLGFTGNDRFAISRNGGGGRFNRSIPGGFRCARSSSCRSWRGLFAAGCRHQHHGRHQRRGGARTGRHRQLCGQRRGCRDRRR